MINSHRSEKLYKETGEYIDQLSPLQSYSKITNKYSDKLYKIDEDMVQYHSILRFMFMDESDD